MSASTHTEPAIYGLLAEFAEAADVVRAARSLRDAGFTNIEAYSPFPIEGLSEALGQKKSYLTRLIFCGGLVGGLTGFMAQWWIRGVYYPMNIGGKPILAWPMFIPVTFELTVLFAALTAVFGMFALNGFPRPYNPLFNVPEFDAASRDRFFLCVESTDPRFDLNRTRALLAELRPVRDVAEVPW